MRPRDFARERGITELAARAGGFFDADGNGRTFGLDEYSDHRALPGGVRTGIDWTEEGRQEAADLRNYLVWRIEEVMPGVEAGDSDCCDVYARHMAALTGLIAVWHALHN